MPTLIHADLTADRETIVLLAGGGDAVAIAAAAKQLGLLTPLFSKSKPAGALTTAATWPAVIQLSQTFGAAWRPGPALQAWMAEQITARSAAPVDTLVALAYVPPAGLTPYPWQTAGGAMIAATGRALITDEPGCISGDAEISINRCGKGFRITLRDLVARFTGTGCYSGPQWDLSKPTYVQREVDGVVRLGRIVNAWSSGPKQTYTVTTETGRTVRATDEHPFLTERGWLRLDELVAGDLVHVRGGRSSTGRQTKQRYREVAGLRAHPFARGLGRRTSTHRVAEHRLVAEATRNHTDLEHFVEMIRDGRVEDLEFLDPSVWAVHHRDHDHTNNTPSNLQVLTHSEHHRLHAREGKADHVALQIAHERVVSVVHHGIEQTYDLEVADDPHNFIADGFVVHNTGKTITAILGLLERAGRRGSKALGVLPVLHEPALVVCPASVIDSWVEAWATWAPHVRVAAWRGSPKKRHALAGTADVYVVGYETARVDAGPGNLKGLAPLRELGIGAMVIDECHLIKNHQSARSQAVRRLARKIGPDGTVVALSGTPITHHPGDLWASLDALEHDAWPSRERWVQRYCQILAANATGGPDEILGLLPAAEPEFRLCLLGQMRRVAKADVLSQLPPKTYSVRTVDLPSGSGNNWRKAYDEFEDQMIAELPSADGGTQELSVMEVMAKFTHLTALASAPADVEVTEDVDEQTGEVRRHVHLVLKRGSWKVEALLEVLAERPGEPVVACAPSRQLVVLAGQAAEAEGLRVGYIVGGQSAAERTAAVNAFQAGGLDLICVTTGAGGVGITLTAARTVVFLQRPWSLVEALQMEDRCHRIGSERHDSIEVIDIVARNTIDTRVRAVLRERAGQLSDLVQDPRVASELLGGADRHSVTTGVTAAVTPTRTKEHAA